MLDNTKLVIRGTKFYPAKQMYEMINNGYITNTSISGIYQYYQLNTVHFTQFLPV